jgi:hypothetical protein
VRYPTATTAPLLHLNSEMLPPIERGSAAMAELLDAETHS